MKNRSTTLMVILPVLACFALLPGAQGQVFPPPDGCYPNFTTAEGCEALSVLAAGIANTGLGWRSLFSDTTGNLNTGVGAGTLSFNNADSNTAVGAAALLFNTTGGSKIRPRARGTLEVNTTGGPITRPLVTLRS